MTKLAKALALLATGVMVLSACSVGTPGQNKQKGGLVRFAEPPATKPNYILPLAGSAYFSVVNLSQFQYFLYRPLYWFGENGTVKLNASLSLAQEPQYSADGKTVTIKLKDWKWSDGQPITSRDVEFWMNLLKANTKNWAAYLPGGFPDNVTAMSFPDAHTAVFTLDKKYGSYFYTYNELSQITPLPQHVWDKTSASGSIGDYDRSKSGAQQVFTFLDAQAKSLGTYATNPLWQVVDGPWKLKELRTDGFLDLVPNPNYSGPQKPTISEFQELPFTTEEAEFNVLRSGGVDIGYLPTVDISQKGYMDSHGYKFEPWIGWSINYFPENFNNPTKGAIFKQLYIRQAFQHLVDQDTVINKFLHGYGYHTYGPVPLKPDNSFIDSQNKQNPFSFSVDAANKLLDSHGWKTGSDGVRTCQSAGSADNQCGPGVKAGDKLQFKLEYATGTQWITNAMEVFQSDASKAGIKINLAGAPFDTVISDAAPCSGSSCNWEMENWGGGWIFAPDYYPTGDELWATGAGSNDGSYSDPQMDKLIGDTTTGNSTDPLFKYEDYAQKQLPVIWMPNADYELTEYKNNLHGVTPQDPILQLYPENLYYTK